MVDSTAAPLGPRVTVRPSAVVELCWLLHAAEREDFRLGNLALRAFYDEHPDLLRRISSFWQDEASGDVGFLELLVVAHHGQLLFACDLAALIGRLDDLWTSAPTDLRLASESPEDQRIVRERLMQLRHAPERRRAYAALVADTWEAMRAPWQHTGLRCAEAESAVLRDRMARGTPWSELVLSECRLGDLLPQLVAALEPDGEVAIVPAFFTHKGLLLDLPGLVLVGMRADPSGPQARARTEGLARRLKMLADPTRLAIVDHLVARPRTVSELARSFGIAQPTVSNHVKLLRDAGLVTDERIAGRRQLVVDRRTVTELLEHLQAVLASPPAHSGPST